MNPLDERNGGSNVAMFSTTTTTLVTHLCIQLIATSPCLIPSGMRILDVRILAEATQSSLAPYAIATLPGPSGRPDRKLRGHYAHGTGRAERGPCMGRVEPGMGQVESSMGHLEQGRPFGPPNPCLVAE